MALGGRDIDGVVEGGNFNENRHEKQFRHGGDSYVGPYNHQCKFAMLQTMLHAIYHAQYRMLRGVHSPRGA